MSAFIETLQAQLIQIQGAIFGGNRFVKKNGQIVDRGENYSGFCVGEDGIFKASGAELSGNIYANSGFFRGDIVSGPIFASNEEIAGSPPITFSANQTARDVFNHFGLGSHPIQSGSFGGQDGIIVITCRMDRVTVNTGIGLGAIFDRFNIDIQIIDKDPITKSWYDYSSGRDTLGATLILNGGRGGKTFILSGIPANPNQAGIGQLYTDPGNNVLRIKR